MPHRRLVWTRLAGLALVGLAVLGLVAAGPPQRRAAAPAARVQPEDTRLAPTEPVPMLRVQMVVFRLLLDTSHAVELDAKALAKEGTTSAALSEALQRLGAPTVSCHLDQLLAADGCEHVLARGTQDVPYLSKYAAATGQDAQVSTSVGRQLGGVRVKAQAVLVAGGVGQQANLGLEISVSDMWHNSADVQPPMALDVFGRASLDLSGPVKLGRPTILVHYAGSDDRYGPGVAYVTLLTVSREP